MENIHELQNEKFLLSHDTVSQIPVFCCDSLLTFYVVSKLMDSNTSIGVKSFVLEYREQNGPKIHNVLQKDATNSGRHIADEVYCE